MEAGKEQAYTITIGILIEELMIIIFLEELLLLCWCGRAQRYPAGADIRISTVLAQYHLKFEVGCWTSLEAED